MFDYKNTELVKLSDEFKDKFTVNIKGKEAIKVDGLVALAHDKGLKSMKTTILQFPSQENQWTCIASTKIIGYGYNPVTEKVEEVEFEDFADANPNNCTAMTKSSYIRMASTRSVGRALRKYTNVDMVCSDEIGDVTEEPPKKLITVEMLTSVKELLFKKQVTQETFGKILFDAFNTTNYQSLTIDQGKELINILNNYNSDKE